jgi:hypothetical protein
MSANQKYYNPNFKVLLQLIFEHCNKSKTCKYNIYQNNRNVDLLSYKLSCISHFIQRLYKIVHSDLSEEKKIQQVRRFKDNKHQPIFNQENAKKVLLLMNSFLRPEGRKLKKDHHSFKKNTLYKNSYQNLKQHKERENLPSSSLTPQQRDIYIQHFYKSLSPEQLQLLKKFIKGRAQIGGAGDPGLVKIRDLETGNTDFFRTLFKKISERIQADKTYGTLESIGDYKQRLDQIIRKSVQDMDVPKRMKYFVDNIGNLADAIYPSNMMNFVKKDMSITSKMKNEFAEPYELLELVLFALSVIPIPIFNLIPDFMLIVNGILNWKRPLFVILSSIALMVKMMTLLFFDFGPIIKMFYLTKKIKNFNSDDLMQVTKQAIDDVIAIPGGVAGMATGVASKALAPLAAASKGIIRPENLKNMTAQFMNTQPVNIGETIGKGLGGAAEMAKGAAGEGMKMGAAKKGMDAAGKLKGLAGLGGLKGLAGLAEKAGGLKGSTGLAEKAGGLKGSTGLAEKAGGLKGLAGLGGLKGLAGLAAAAAPAAAPGK